MNEAAPGDRSGPQNVSFPSGDGSAFGYLATPEESGPGVIVIQEWWGLTDHVRTVTDRFAAAGFVALAPDLYGGRVAHDREEARVMMRDLPVEHAASDLAGAIEFLRNVEAVIGDRFGAVGFCMGGGFVLVMAALQPDDIGAAVPFYAVGAYDDVDLSTIKAPILGHFASEDASAPPEKVAALEDRLSRSDSSSVDLRIYPNAGHAFFNDESPNYDPVLSDRCWADTVSFLEARLG